MARRNARAQRRQKENRKGLLYFVIAALVLGVIAFGYISARRANRPLDVATLLFMGLTFAVISALAAFKSDDPYPRFGETYRRHENRCEEYSDDFEEALDDLKAIRDKAITDLRETLQQLQGQFALRGQIIDARRSLLNRFAQHQDALETFGRSLIDHYRSKNRDARSSPPPPYFDEKWTMARTPVPAVPDEVSIEEEVREASANLSQSITRISEGYDQAIRSFQSLEDIRAELETSKKDPLDGQA